METLKMSLVCAVLLAIYGVVGRMDYEDAVLMARAQGRDDLQLACRPPPVDPPAYRQAPVLHPATSGMAIINRPKDESEMYQIRVLRCIVLEE